MKVIKLASKNSEVEEPGLHLAYRRHDCCCHGLGVKGDTHNSIVHQYLICHLGTLVFMLSPFDTPCCSASVKLVQYIPTEE